MKAFGSGQIVNMASVCGGRRADQRRLSGQRGDTDLGHALSASGAARMILAGVAEDRAVIVFPKSARRVAWMYRHFPRYALRRL